MKNNLPLQMIRCLSLERKTHEHRGYNGTINNMCSRLFVCYFLVVENYRSFVDIFWITEVIGKLYYVQSADENVGGSLVDIFWKTEVIGKLCYVRSAEKTWVIRWLTYSGKRK